MSEQEPILAGYFQLMNINGAAHVYREAVRAGVLDAMRGSRQTADEIAAACKLAARPTGLLLEALAALGVVERVEDRFVLTLLAQMLLSGSYRNLSDEYWSHLPALLQTDQPLVKMDAASQSEAFYQSQAAVLGWMLTPAAECAARVLCEIGLPKTPASLDVGAGSAIWSLTLARQLPGATVTAVDWPAVLEVAAETAANFGLADRLTTIAGNYHEVPWPATAFDLVILANITHLETPAGNRALFAQAKAALKPGGQLAIVDIFAGQPAGDLNRTLYTLGLALRTEHGHVYSVEELTRLLAESGFNPPQLFPLEVPPYAVGLLTATVGQAA